MTDIDLSISPNDPNITPLQREHAARVMDALGEIQSTINAFQRYMQQPLSMVCEHYWNTVISNMPENTAIVVVPQTDLISYNPEPDNPDSGAQLLHMLSGLEPTEENIVKYGTPMGRVITPRYSMPIELLSVVPTDSTVGQLDALLKQAITAIVTELQSALAAQPQAENVECITTPVQGSVVINSSNPELLDVYVYVLAGFRDKHTKGAIQLP